MNHAEIILPHWQLLSETDMDALNAAVEEQHHAVQVLAAVARAFVEPKEDDSHTNLGWWAGHGMFVTHFLGNRRQLALRPGDRSLVLLEEGVALETFCLEGHTLDAIHRWTSETLGNYGFDASRIDWQMHYEIPRHALAEGAPFPPVPANAAKDWDRLRSNARLTLTCYVTEYEEASDQRIWPHHFDSGVYIPQEKGEDGSVKNSFSLGLAMHDDHIPCPYFYVTHWSAEAIDYPDTLPEIPAGAYWQREGFVGAILHVTEIAALPTVAMQVEAITEFLNSAIDASKGLLGIS